MLIMLRSFSADSYGEATSSATVPGSKLRDAPPVCFWATTLATLQPQPNKPKLEVVCNSKAHAPFFKEKKKGRCDALSP